MIATYFPGSQSTGYGEADGFTPLNDPLGIYGTELDAINGNDIVGSYNDNSGSHGFVFNGTSFQTIDDPLAAVATNVTGISGDVIVGNYDGGKGFIDVDGTFTSPTIPGASGSVFIAGISGNQIVGSYTDSNDVSQSFVATIPEPSTFALLVLGGLVLCITRRVIPRYIT